MKGRPRQPQVSGLMLCCVKPRVYEKACAFHGQPALYINSSRLSTSFYRAHCALVVYTLQSDLGLYITTTPKKLSKNQQFVKVPTTPKRD